MSFIVTLILFILILGSIVFVHEFGHFMMAKLNGVYVYEFAIGMGPKIWSKKGKETEYTLRAIPIGGFCMMAGEDLEDDDLKKIPKEKRLQAKKPWQRFLIMFFGAGNNFICAVLLLFLIGLIWGGSSMEPVVTSVVKNSAAATSGIEAGDRILEINGHSIATTDDISLYLAIANPEEASDIKVRKENKKVETYSVQPKKKKVDGETTYQYGIGMQQDVEKGILPALEFTGKKTISIFKQMTVTVGYLFTGGISISQLSGPVGIFSVVGDQSSAGIMNILYLVAFLSINVGFINLLPIPAFDGGHILFIIIEKIKGSPVKPETENMIHTVGLFLLMLLMVVITFNDILRLF
ncbi:MAG: RIP metalloprotease RseP [Candidatus Faecimonas sp.]|nr:RIP metalloprotease RseP [Mycoplasmatota bacterium]MDY2908726.1 RIP metalloprotease RseP [Candidatus Faecimonas sp.]